MLSERGIIRIKVFYTWGEAVLQEKYDPGFGKTIEWDIPLLEGYEYSFVKNVSTQAGSHHFNGIDNPTIIREIIDWNADGILVIGWSFKSHLKLLRYFKGKKTVLFRGDSNLLDETAGLSLKKTARRLFLKWVYRHVDKALYVGTANKNYYLAHGLKHYQLIHAPHAIDNDRFLADKAIHKRSELGIPEEAIVFLFVGKFQTKKDPQLLLDTFTRLKNSKAHLLMVGDGEMEAELKTTVDQKSRELKHNIHFLPFQNQLQMPSVYKLGDVFVLPSQGPGETWGLSVNEAMACSKAVLISDKCGCALDLVQDGINGYVFKSRDGNSLLKKMEMFLSGRQAITQMGNQSLGIIQSGSRFENICIAVEESLQ